MSNDLQIADTTQKPTSMQQTSRIGRRLYQYVWALGTIAIVGIISLILGISFLAWKQVDSRLLDAKRHAIAITEEFRSTQEGDLRVISNFLSHSQGKEVDDILRLTLLRDRKITGLYIIDADGSISNQHYMPRTKIKQQWPQQPWHEKLSKGETYISHQFREGKPIPSLIIAVSILGKDNLHEKTLLAQIDLSQIWSSINRINLGETGFIYMADDKGNLVLHRTMSFLSQRLTVNDLIQQPSIELKDNGMQLIKDNEGNRSLVSTSVIKGLNWVIIAEQPLADFFNALFIFLTVLSLAFLLVLFIVSSAESFTRVEIVQPLSNLHAAVKEFERGNLLHQVPHSGKHELHELGQVLNDIGAQLHQTLADLSQNLDELTDNRQALLDSEQRYKSVVNNIQEVIIQTDDSGILTFLNPAWVELTGYGMEESLGQRLLDFIPENASPQHQQNIKLLLSGEREIFEGELNFKHKKNENIWVELIARVSFSKTGNFTGVYGTLNDITKRREIYEQLKLIASVYTHAREAILITSPVGKIIEVNPAFMAITGYTRDQVIGKHLRVLRPYQQTPRFYSKLWRDLNKNGYWTGDIRNQHLNGRPYTISLTMSAVYNQQGEVQNYLGLFSDITERQAHQEQLEQIAHYDSLTGLPNRLMLIKILNQHLEEPDFNLAVVYLDLDGFKEINDTYGHAIGDKFLSEIAKKLKRCLRQVDIICRLGGDEFVAVLIGVKPDNDETALLKRLLDAAAASIYIDGYKLQVSASLGVTFHPQDKECGADKLLRQADQAMYEAKLAGRNQYRIFDTLKDSQLQGQNRNLERIRTALNNDEFELLYQPKVNMRTGELIGAEALIRWKHPDKGVLPPADFIPLIEDNALSIDLGNWVINKALVQIKCWQDICLHTKISVNISGYHLLQTNFVSKLQDLIAQHETVSPSSLEIEILESNALDDLGQISQVISQCQALNINIALDDFGTGYSTLTYLKHLPASQLKIDRSFVRDLLEDPNNLAIVDSVMGMANAFQREVIAEGVETVAQGKLLLQLGCELAQGYCIARPMRPDDFIEWHKNWQPPETWKNQNRIHRTNLPLLFVKNELQNWVRDVTQKVNDERTININSDYSGEHFNQWLFHSSNPHKDNKDIQELIDLHQNIYRIGKDLIQTHHHTDTTAHKPSKQLSKLIQLKDEFLEKVRRIQ